ncbi:hypothetical protein CRYUN_Cryun30bG0014700 [Craigia yunnanensis]
MDIEAPQPKQERSRTRWTASLDRIFSDLVVKQIQLGNRPNNVFDKKTWNNIRDDFNKQTDLNFNNDQLRKHLDVLRTRFYNLKSAYDQNDFAGMEDSCCIGFDLWEDIGVNFLFNLLNVCFCHFYCLFLRDCVYRHSVTVPPCTPQRSKARSQPDSTVLSALGSRSPSRFYRPSGQFASPRGSNPGTLKYLSLTHLVPIVLARTIGTKCVRLRGARGDRDTQPRPEPVKIKDCPIYEQLCTIFTDSSADGKYAQSSHFEGLDKAAGNDTGGLISCPEGGSTLPDNPSTSRLAQNNSLSEKLKSISEKKRKQPSETQSSLDQSRKDEEMSEAMAGAMLDMLAAWRLRRTIATKRSDDKFSITNCIKALDEIEDIEEWLYFAALDLFEDPNLRETFISLKAGKIRLTWLHGKCGKPATTYV